ncbi:hypothetical protein QQP08_017475 [Theobroma cacao]|nr:hypothetical protein QQP08_017475 [Theobroma cacao]
MDEFINRISLGRFSRPSIKIPANTNIKTKANSRFPIPELSARLPSREVITFTIGICAETGRKPSPFLVPIPKNRQESEPT